MSGRFSVNLCVALLAMTLSVGAIRAQPSGLPQLQTHQAYIEDVTRRSTLDIKDPMAVFAFVFNSLPDTVKVYPTENYYYFTFMLNGSQYAGNIRLDASERDQGKVRFAYFEQTNEWRYDAPGEYLALDQANGVKLEKLERFKYRLSYRDKSVVFELNDLSQVKPPANALSLRETFIGPVFDDSGIRFFLVYNAAANNFIYILDETVKVADDFFSEPGLDRILVGKRTGFAFYRDHRLDRKIMIGAYDENANVNNYFDGPFDQLPDNFIEGDALRDAILKVQPNLKGRIDRFGGTPDGALRYSIVPYKLYRFLTDFKGPDRCAVRRQKSEGAYYNCLIFNKKPQSLSTRPETESISKPGTP